MIFFQKWLTLFLLFSSHCFGLTLLDKFLIADCGSYIVTEQNRTCTLLHLHSKTKDELVLEEVSIPSHLAKQIEWKKWIQAGAPGHTSWVMYAINTEYLTASECYSFSIENFLVTETFDTFLSPLLTLDLKEVSEEKRKMIIPAARPGEVENKKLWGPTLYRSGEKVNNPIYDVYETVWPDDDSELSGKRLTLYFDHNQPLFPFPYWMQLKNGAMKFKIRALDSGNDLVSPHKTLPRRRPFFMKKIEKKEGNMLLFLTAPLYYSAFKLYAVDMTTNPRNTQNIPFKLSRIKEELTLSINDNTLDHLFVKGHKYVWLVSTEEDSLYIESPHPYIR